MSENDLNEIEITLKFKIPKELYCWNRLQPMCEHFDNEGGRNWCKLFNVGYLLNRPMGVIPCDECLNARKIK